MPEPSGGVSPAKMGVGIGVLVLLNYVFTELMDDSGLHVLMLTARLPAGTNHSTRAAFRARAELSGATLEDASEAGALRFELMEHRDADANAFTALLVSRQQIGATALPTWLSSELDPVESTRRLRTFFPERSRWVAAPPQLEPGELGELGRVGLLVQQNTWTFSSAAAADAFRRGWSDLGYNALGEAGVVRCDLLALEEVDGSAASAALVTRKVFRDEAALRSHEQTEHYARWRASLATLDETAAEAARMGESVMLDTLLPRSSAYPFRTRWATA